MLYVSTRGHCTPIPSAGAILQGLAPDGGLYVPASFPFMSLDEIASLSAMPYAQRAAHVMGKFLTDFSADELSAFTMKAYYHFDDPDVAPLRKVNNDGLWSLELFHGPTLAFKDMALQMLPHLMSASLSKTGQTQEVFILVATSGDTGKAAMEGFADVPCTRCAVFYPKDGVSPLQKKQMETQMGGNVHVIAVEGNFDDAQTGVKHLFQSESFKNEMAAQGRMLSSANSMNWGRLVPQIVYYFSAYASLVQNNEIALGEKINFVVPTGNFGNILAGYYAKRMGLPVGKLICASNANHILTDFIKTGVYDRNRAFHKTISPSMDILISSNLERLLYALCEQQPEIVRSWMAQLTGEGRYDIGAYTQLLQQIMEAGWCSDEEALCTIKRLQKEHGYLSDPHTAVAFAVHDAYQKETGDMNKTVVVSTASPYKFPENVAHALEMDDSKQDAFVLSKRLQEQTGMRVPQSIWALEHAPVMHSASCKREDMANALIAVLAQV